MFRTKAIITGLWAGALFFGFGCAGPRAGTKVGDPALDFTLKTYDGDSFRLSEVVSKSRGVYLFFFHPLDPKSRPYLGEMNRIARKFGPRGLTVFGIYTPRFESAISDPRLNDRNFSWFPDFVRKRKVEFPILFDPALSADGKTIRTVTGQYCTISPDEEMGLKSASSVFTPDAKAKTDKKRLSLLDFVRLSAKLEGKSDLPDDFEVMSLVVGIDHGGIIRQKFLPVCVKAALGDKENSQRLMIYCPPDDKPVYELLNLPIEEEDVDR